MSCVGPERKRAGQPDPWTVSRPRVSQRAARGAEDKGKGRRLERTVSDWPPTAGDLDREGNAAFWKLKATGPGSGTWVLSPRVWRKKLRRPSPGPPEEEGGAEGSADLSRDEAPAVVERSQPQGDPGDPGAQVPDDMPQDVSTRKRKAGHMEEWRKFTPPCIQPELCMARTWGAGRGGQCSKKPLDGCRFCGTHVKQQGQRGWHGAVDEEIPAKKLLEFKTKGTPRADAEVFGAERAEVAAC